LFILPEDLLIELEHDFKRQCFVFGGINDVFYNKMKPIIFNSRISLFFRDWADTKKLALCDRAGDGVKIFRCGTADRNHI